jgi:hypothetical protein
VLLLFLGGVKNLTAYVFPWRLNSQGNNLWRPALKEIAISLSLYPWRPFLECQPPVFISLAVSGLSLRVFDPQGYSGLW